MNKRPEVDHKFVFVKMFSSLSARNTNRKTTYAGDVYREYDINILQMEVENWLQNNEYIEIVSTEQTQGMFESRTNRFPWITISIFYKDITEEAWEELNKEESEG
ncbi:hypothetical protein COU75_00390 [Candidatus Peregrinibacteria bacterium CG10_big_fil_rev_8_21_14_0_10_42_8]|nr:MAG: hypothetical protein COU75_00390 [Candidatus Peregrinibacteria bacterium CG10_big_fil_rev_8_21_14_0_10_42_8]